MMGTTYPKSTVVFAGSRDHYQLPVALNEDNLLEALVTDLYWPNEQKWFSSLVRPLVPDRWISKRYRHDLPSTRTRLAYDALLMSTFRQARILPSATEFIGHSLGRKARGVAAANGSCVFATPACAFEAFKEGPDRPKYRFLFQFQAHPLTAKRLQLVEIEQSSPSLIDLPSGYELSVSPNAFDKLSVEPHLANGWMTPSRFCANTLSEHGIDPKRIWVIPYGVDSETFINRLGPPVMNKPFRAVYVGRIVRAKGLGYLVDALRLLKTRNIEVKFYTHDTVEADLLEQFRELNIEVRTGITGRKLALELHNADVFVFPSLAEGFGHVVLEAMACGVPVIATDHTCAPDVINNGEHGFVIPAHDVHAIAEKLSWGIDHRQDLGIMGERAAERARQFTWDNFRIGVRNAYKQMIDTVTES